MGNAQLQRTYGHVLVLSSRRLVRPAVDDDFEYGKRSQKKKKKGRKKFHPFAGRQLANVAFVVKLLPNSWFIIFSDLFTITLR